MLTASAKISEREGSSLPSNCPTTWVLVFVSGVAEENEDAGWLWFYHFASGVNQVKWGRDEVSPRFPFVISGVSEPPLRLT